MYTRVWALLPFILPSKSLQTVQKGDYWLLKMKRFLTKPPNFVWWIQFRKSLYKITWVKRGVWFFCSSKEDVSCLKVKYWAWNSKLASQKRTKTVNFRRKILTDNFMKKQNIFFDNKELHKLFYDILYCSISCFYVLWKKVFSTVFRHYTTNMILNCKWFF